MHSELMMLHDTLGSGILYYNADALRVELIPTGPAPSGAHPLVPAVYFDAYDATGGQTTSSTAITLNLDTERANSHTEIFSLASDILTIKMRGTYEFEFHFTCTTTGSTRSSHTATLERRPVGGAFVGIVGSDATQYTRNATTTSTGSKKIIVDDVKEEEDFRVSIVQTAATVSNTSTQVDASSLTVRRLA
jgi:hypothetical protein